MSSCDGVNLAGVPSWEYSQKNSQTLHNIPEDILKEVRLPAFNSINPYFVFLTCLLASRSRSITTTHGFGIMLNLPTTLLDLVIVLSSIMKKWRLSLALFIQLRVFTSDEQTKLDKKPSFMLSRNTWTEWRRFIHFITRILEVLTSESLLLLTSLLWLMTWKNCTGRLASFNSPSFLN